MNHSTTRVETDAAYSEVGASEASQPLAISFRWLLAIYGIIPVIALVILFDVLFLHSYLRSIFPDSPYGWWIGAALFNFPHIFASQFSLFDREYAQQYRRLLWGIPLVILFGFLMAAFINPTGFFVFEFITIYHVIFQQIGLTRLIMGQADRSFTVWKWLFFGAFAFAHLGFEFRQPFWFLALTVGPLLLPTTFLAYKAARCSKTDIGRRYLWANQGMLLSAAACYPLGYPVFSVLIPRAIHDISAFTFYIDHDRNRNTPQIKNGFYRLLSVFGIPIILTGPLFAVGLNVVLRMYENFLLHPFFYIPVITVHYYTERVIWRSGTIHRKSVVVKP